MQKKKRKKNDKKKISNIALFLIVIAIAVVLGCFNIDNLNEKNTDDPYGELSEFLATVQTEEEAEEETETQAGASTEIPTTEEKKINDETGRIIIDPEQELWNLVVVNTSREMPADYEPELEEILWTGYYMDERVVPYYEDMYNAAKADGIILTPYSGYRSYARQERNYKNLTETYMSEYGISREEAAKKAATVILPPGTSEHNLGLAMDICNTLDSFAFSEEYAWLTENAHKYGFILRYTEDKMDITGIVDEPWHWRFVGVEYAEDIRNSGLCLEEYLDMMGIDY